MAETLQSLFCMRQRITNEHFCVRGVELLMNSFEQPWGKGALVVQEQWTVRGLNYCRVHVFLHRSEWKETCRWKEESGTIKKASIQKKKKNSGKAAENSLKESSVRKVHKNISLELLHWNLVKVHELLIVGFLSHFVGAICKPTKCCLCSSWLGWRTVVYWLVACGQGLHTEVWLTVWFCVQQRGTWLIGIFDLRLQFTTVVG